MSRYILAPFAQQDLLQIRDYYLTQAGARVARRILVEFVQTFRTIARNPLIGHTRPDLVGHRPVLYRRESTPVEIIAILHASRDVPAILERQIPIQ